MYVLAGCLGLVVIGVLIVAGTGYFVAKKVKDAGVDPALFRTNPMVAAAKVLARNNPDLDVLSVDKDTGVVTVRQKSTGKTVTLDFED